MRKGLKKANAWLLALALLVSLLAVPRAYGAYGIDTGKSCALTLELDGQYEELKELSIPVKIYRVASVGADGRYAPLESYGGLDFSGVSSETTAEDWSKMAQQASAAVQAAGSEPTATTTVQKLPGQAEAQGQAANLPTGMYLVEAEMVKSPEYEYNFIPYLVALPNNYYGETGDDAWVYDVDSILKPEQKERFGSLIIEKELLAYNETFGGADFVFKVEAEKGGKPVYSNVLSLAFDAPGEKSLQIDGLPAGAKVTVTEVYSGSCYEIVADAQRVQTVDHIIAEGEEGSPQRVRFQNTYDKHPNGGSSIVNHFRYEGNGIWGEPQQQRDSAQ